MINIEYIRNARIEKGYTQKQIADKIEMSEASYRNFETGFRGMTFARIKALAKVLSLDMNKI